MTEDEYDDDFPSADEVIEIPVSDTLDLHSFRPAEVASAAIAYLEAAREAGFSEVRLIHGKGIGVQRASIQKQLARLDWVASFADADPSGGSWGATIVILHPTERESS